MQPLIYGILTLSANPANKPEERVKQPYKKFQLTTSFALPLIAGLTIGGISAIFLKEWICQNRIKDTSDSKEKKQIRELYDGYAVNFLMVSLISGFAIGFFNMMKSIINR
jgi:hypothetical protein